MKNNWIILFVISFSISGISQNAKVQKITFSEKTVKQLVQLPLKCVETEFPNKLSQVIGNESYLKTPKELHPSFFGCFDWHSAVHGHWSLVKLLKDNPKMEGYSEIMKILKNHINKENIAIELKYFDDKYNKNYERTYGWAWLLKLAEELHTWQTKDARVLEKDLQPLTDLIVNKYIEFLPKLNYPIRVGTHTNTAFGLNFAYDYASTLHNVKLQEEIAKRALYFYKNDANCPINWEPSGTDFLSACLQEATLMRKILGKKQFTSWLKQFLPELLNKKYQLAVGVVSDRTDGHLVHLDGLNFSRAWCLNEMARDIPELEHLHQIANEHIRYSLPNLIGDSYEGGHWLATFAIYAIDSQ